MNCSGNCETCKIKCYMNTTDKFFITNKGVKVDNSEVVTPKEGKSLIDFFVKESLENPDLEKQTPKDYKIVPISNSDKDEI